MIQMSFIDCWLVGWTTTYIPIKHTIVLNIIVDKTVNHHRFWDACSFIDQTNAAKIVLTIVSVFLLSLSLAHVAAFLRGRNQS